ncbi:alcohol dehydrogenase catalytic domain-containing protein [Bacillus sp. FJAT-49825]|uniref:Alcohol dehydrogenase catalytic domain-containing protein n=1 Tax=Neobacillus rhizophilus TaxID=2833579 RepID=A0A942YVQ3_9BACI|nr:alcohol dehydrogenase catalytic domain-containing protein [Neobacillus rhizophilus]
MVQLGLHVPISSNQVNVKVAWTGICGSDLHKQSFWKFNNIFCVDDHKICETAIGI